MDASVTSISLTAEQVSPPSDEIDRLGERIVAAAGRLAAATCEWLLLVADFDACCGFERFVLPSTAHWLAHSCSIAQRTAVEHVRVARALAAHPVLAAEMSAGRLSYSHVRAISRVYGPGDTGPVEDLVDVAKHGTVAQLEAIVRGLRTVDDNLDAEGRPPEAFVRQAYDDTSQWRLNARLAPEDGAVVAAALDRLAAVEGLSSTEALVRLAQIGLAALADAQQRPRELRGDELAAVVVHLDASRFESTPDDEPAAPDGDLPRQPQARSAERACSRRPAARIANGPGLPARVVERLVCAGRVRTVLHGYGDRVLDVGRSHRLVTERQFRALLVRDHGHCAFPGCRSTRGLQAHHVVHWLRGGRTDVSNLVLLCERHHHALHDGVFGITTVGDGFVFRLSGGMVLSGFPPDAHSSRLASEPLVSEPLSWLEQTYREVADDAARSRWDGQRLDRCYAVAVLADRRLRSAG